MALPENINEDKLAKISLAILSVSMHGQDRVSRIWKALDWDIMDLLFEKGWISDTKSNAKSVVITEAGIRQAQETFTELFQKP